MPEPLVIFLHLPKAAGSTLNRVMAQQYPAEAIYKLGGKNPDVLRKEVAEVTRPPSAIRLLTGHHGFGVHEGLDRDFTYITVLRDPVERVLSHFHFARRLESHPLHAEIASGKVTAPEIARRLANLQTRYLADDAHRGTAETADAATLANAKANLEKHFSVIGLAERFDETLILLQRRLGWRIRPFANSNVTKGRPGKSALSPEDIADIRASNALDVELHEWAKARLDREIAEAGADFQSAVSWLRWKNRAWSWVGSLLPKKS